MLLTAADIVAKLPEVTGESNSKGDATISINVTNVDEAKSTIQRLKGIKRRLKLVKRESAQAQATIRAVNPLDETDTFLSDLLERHISPRLDDNSRASVSVKKHTLTTLYKQAGFVIDGLVLKINDMLVRLDDCIARNSETRIRCAPLGYHFGLLFWFTRRPVIAATADAC